MNALDLFNPTDLSIPSERIMALFAGESGTGKDCHAVSFAKAGEVYVFDIDHRIRGIIPARKWLGDEIFQRITFEQYEPQDGFKAIDDKLSNFLILAKQRKLQYKTIYITSVSSLSFLLLIDSQRLQGRYQSSTMAYTAGDGASKGHIRGAVSIATPDDWKYVEIAWRQLIFNALLPLFKMGVNIIVSCWVAPKWGKDKDNENKYAPSIVIGERTLGPSLNLSEEIPGYFDETYRFIKEEEVNGQVKYKAKFSGMLSKSVYDFADSNGKKITELDVTNACFYDKWKELITQKGKESANAGTRK